MKNPIRWSLLVVGLGVSLCAGEKKVFPQILFVDPVGSGSVLPEEYLILVVEPGFISHALWRVTQPRRE